jgi:hypothetical protein
MKLMIFLAIVTIAVLFIGISRQDEPLTPEQARRTYIEEARRISDERCGDLRDTKVGDMTPNDLADLKACNARGH